MHWESIVLLVVIALGGAAVIGSYMVGLRGKPEASDALWGGVPAKIRPVYGVSMILSGIGFLAVLFYVFFKLDPPKVVIAGRYGFDLFFPIFITILAPSALWMPLSKVYVKRPSTVMWIIIRWILFLVGLASIELVWVLFALDVNASGAAYWLATVGACYFAFHTFVLDAIVWAALFRRPQQPNEPEKQKKETLWQKSVAVWQKVKSFKPKPKSVKPKPKVAKPKPKAMPQKVKPAKRRAKQGRRNTSARKR